MELIPDWHAQRVRAHRLPQGLGDIESTVATGRATCRECGHKITKGDPALRFAYDFTGCGSWTAVTCYIHAVPCVNPSAPTVAEPSAQ